MDAKLEDVEYGLLCPPHDYAEDEVDGEEKEHAAGTRKRPSTKPQDLARVAIVIFGLLHIIFFLASVALGIGAICTRTTGYFIGYGIWCGFIFFLAGIMTLTTAGKSCRSINMITTSLVFNVLAACSAAVQFSLGIVAGANDRLGPNDRLTSSSLDDIERFDIFYSKHVDWFTCAGSNYFAWTDWGAINVLLVIAAGLEAFTAVFSAALACRSVCCGKVLLIEEYVVEDEMVLPLEGAYNGGSGIYRESTVIQDPTMRGYYLHNPAYIVD